MVSCRRITAFMLFEILPVYIGLFLPHKLVRETAETLKDVYSPVFMIVLGYRVHWVFY